MVKVIDRDALTKVVREGLMATHGLEASSLEEVKPWVQYYGIVNDAKQGRDVFVLINEEGVGYTADEMDRASVLYYANGYGSTGWIDIHQRVIEGCLTGEEIDLADVIREFGDRLETNFYLWYQRL
jgi:hypothetical protein